MSEILISTIVEIFLVVLTLYVQKDGAKILFFMKLEKVLYK